MTGQVPDQFFYHDKKLDLVGIKGSKLVTPKNFNIVPTMASTACYNGYLMRYKIFDLKLIIDGFWVRVKEETILPAINNIKPIFFEKDRAIEKVTNPPYLPGYFNYEYRDLNYKIPFTGSLWVGDKFIQGEYVHMGFQSASAYEVVLRFDFEDGKVITVKDVSEKGQKAREKGDPKGYQPESHSEEDIKKWIEDRFSLDPKL
jgi:hypothetical protein